MDFAPAPARQGQVQRWSILTPNIIHTFCRRSGFSLSPTHFFRTRFSISFRLSLSSLPWLWFGRKASYLHPNQSQGREERLSRKDILNRVLKKWVGDRLKPLRRQNVWMMFGVNMDQRCTCPCLAGAGAKSIKPHYCRLIFESITFARHLVSNSIIFHYL
jgi:hypothetical protein